MHSCGQFFRLADAPEQGKNRGVLAYHVWSLAHRHRRIDDARAQAIDANTTRAVFDCGSLRQSDDRALGRGVLSPLG
ncbi:hypothetical protein D3C85_1561700 [compost metagenome]